MDKVERDNLRLLKLERGDLKNQWDSYLQDNSTTHFLAVSEKLSFKIPAIYKYPSLHRICDVEISGSPYRVMRLVFHKEFIFINPCEIPNYDNPGVPYWLTGQSLTNWIQDQKQKLIAGVDITKLPETKWEIYK